MKEKHRSLRPASPSTSDMCGQISFVSFVFGSCCSTCSGGVWLCGVVAAAMRRQVEELKRGGRWCLAGLHRVAHLLLRIILVKFLLYLVKK